MSRFLESLLSGRVLLMDGAMGTELQRAGIADDESYELWNLTHPDQVLAIHQAYVVAGADCHLTHTFQANHNLERFGQSSRWPEIVRAAIHNGRRACSTNQFLLASIGPGLRMLLREPATRRQFLSAYTGVDAFLLETQSGFAELREIIDLSAELEEQNRPPILLSLTYGRDADGSISTCVGAGCENQPPEFYAEQAEKSGLAALGVNCGMNIGIDEIIEIVRRYRQATNLPLLARANAGTPTREGARWIYPLTPDAMAARLLEMLEAGATLLGGCCGTTPQHIAACRPIIDAWNRRNST